MNLKKIQMTWDQVTNLPSPLKFGKAFVRVNRFDKTRVYFEFGGHDSENVQNLYRQIKVWLLDSRCVSIKYTYEGTMPTKQLRSLDFTPSKDKIWRRKHALNVAAIPVETANLWILSIENRTGKKGIPVDDCDMSSLFSYQLSINAEGEMVGL